MILSSKQITKALISLRGCAGWSAPLMLATPPKTGFVATRPNYGHDVFGWKRKGLGNYEPIRKSKLPVLATTACFATDAFD